MSIRSRSCPLCAGPLDIEGKCRACTAPAPVASEELVAKAEALFMSYLAARIVRARRAAKAAKVELLRDPRNRGKADAVQTAEQEAQRLQAQLVVHTRQAKHAASGDAEPRRDDSRATSAGAETDDTIASVQTTASDQDHRLCPRCSNRLPSSVNQCRCGYTFESTASTMPSTFLTTAELAALGAGKRR